MNDTSTSQLLDAFRAGDRSAFAELVQIHQGPLLRMARCLLGWSSTYEDVVQEAFLKLAQVPPTLPEEVVGDLSREHAQLSSWLHKVTRNLCMDVMRSETRRRTREKVVALHEATDGEQSSVDARETREVVVQRLEQLPVDQREVLVLRLFGDKSYREIADITGKKVGTVGWLISVGLKALSTELAPLFQTGAAAQARPTITGPAMGFGLAQGELS